MRRCVLTGVNQTSAKLQVARMDEMGCEFVELTAHEGARPEHAVWQGKVYHRGGEVVYNGSRYEDFESATGYGTGPGLCGWNCRHNFYPFYPGVSKRNYTDQRLEELAGPQKYEESQRRRALERRVRDAKRRYLAGEAAGVDTGEAAARLREANRALASFRQETGGNVDSARTSVRGFGRSEAGVATSAAELQERLEAVNEELNYLRQDGIIRSKGSFVMPPKAPETLIFESKQVFQRIMERQLSFTDAEKIIANTRFALRQQNGNLHAYYSDDGFVAVRSDGTVYSMGLLDEGGKKLMEVAKKHGF